MQWLKFVDKIWSKRPKSLSLKSLPALILRSSVSEPSLTPEQRLRRGTEAQQLLDNAILQGAFYALQTDLMQQMSQAKLNDSDGHTRLIMALQINHAVQRHLWHLVQDGQAAVGAIQLRGKRID